MKPRKPLPRQSKKRAAESRVYAKRKKLFLAKNEFCDVCNHWTYPGDRNLHHKRGRAGKLYLDERYWMMVCGGMTGCHHKIHEDRKWAIANGLLGGPGEWGVCP